MIALQRKEHARQTKHHAHHVNRKERGGKTTDLKNIRGLTVVGGRWVVKVHAEDVRQVVAVTTALR